MRYIEIKNGVVQYVLPIELSSEYKILPLNAVEIPLDTVVNEGDIYKNGKFRAETIVEINARTRPAFNAQRSVLFVSTQWVRERHADRLELGIDDIENWSQWLKYWQALRDIPAQKDFIAINATYPEMPK